MATFRPTRRGVSYSEALAAAYASAPESEIILDTLEFRHPAFRDSLGANVAPRVVNDLRPLTATLESGAPLDGGAAVLFQPVSFKFTRPSESESSSSPEVSLTVDNASRILIPYLDMAKESIVPIYVTWRPYLISDLSTPHMVPPLTLTIRSVSTNMTTVTATARFADMVNRRFPASEYTAIKFPGLVAR